MKYLLLPFFPFVVMIDYLFGPLNFDKKFSLLTSCRYVWEVWKEL